jgi:hypothetical protein
MPGLFDLVNREIDRFDGFLFVLGTAVLGVQELFARFVQMPQRTFESVFGKGGSRAEEGGDED